MRKYLNITKMVILEKSQYLYNQLFKMIMYGIFVYIFLQVWKYMYSDNALIAGYTLIQMAWYVAFTEIMFGGFLPRTIRKDLSEEIRGGKIAYILNKPFNYVSYTLSKYFGEAAIGLMTYFTTGILISYFIIGPLEQFNVIYLPLILITLFLAVTIMALLYILISLTAFWVEENKPFFWIYEKLVLCLGVLFPIEIFPIYLQPFIKFSPIYVTMYAPAKMFTAFSFPKFLEVSIFQIGYLIVLGALCTIVYRKGVKKLNVNGG